MCYESPVGRAASVAACLALLACDAAPVGPPNLLLVTIDTLRADSLACYGGEPDVGTGICSLADGGTRFAWAFAAAPHTAPSMASLLTSRYPSFHGVRQGAGSRLRLGDLSVAELLRAAGYTTAAFVSNPVLDPSRNFGQGFDVYDVDLDRRERNRPQAFERVAEDTTDAALAWARGRPAPPWFAWVHFQDPHGPYDPPDARPVRDPPGAEALRVLKKHSGLGGIPAYQALPGLHSTAAYAQRYRDEIRYLDPHVTRLVEGLDALGGRPAVLLAADHGEAFGEDGYYFAHGHSVGLDQIRVPLLWRPARPGPSRVVSTPVSLLDVAPTLLRAAGLEVPPAFAGRPLPLDGGAKPDAERPIFAEHERSVAVVLGPRYWSRERAPGPSGPRYAARSAELAGDGPLPPYAFPDPGASPPLEPLLERFVEIGAGQPPGERGEVPEEMHEQLRALGYAD